MSTTRPLMLFVTAALRSLADGAAVAQQAGMSFSAGNAAHAARGGCGQDALIGTGGAGLLYCLAID
jgi:hypothetical protein